MNTPKISVIMAAYNSERYIADSVKSVLAQTFPDFELIVINDASTDMTLEILRNFNDKRLIVLTNEKNIGSAASRTQAINMSKSEYIAILDADDLAYPTRLEKQIAFMNAHPDFGMLASWVRVIDKEGGPTGVVLKDIIQPEKIPATMLFHNIFACSSAILRRSALPENPFRQEAAPVEDVDLWIRMIDNGWKFNTLPEVLVDYRSHEEGISKVYSNRKREIMNLLIKARLAKLGITPNNHELVIHRTNYSYTGKDTEEFIQNRESWLKKLKIANNNKNTYPEPAFSQVIGERWLASCSANAKLGFWVWKKFWQSDLSKDINKRENWKPVLKFAIKCLFKNNTLNLRTLFHKS